MIIDLISSIIGATTAKKYGVEFTFDTDVEAVEPTAAETEATESTTEATAEPTTEVTVEAEATAEPTTEVTVEAEATAEATEPATKAEATEPTVEATTEATESTTEAEASENIVPEEAINEVATESNEAKTYTRPSEEVDAEVIAAYAYPDQPGIGWLKQDNNPADPKPLPKAPKAKAEEPIIKADIDIIDSSINNVDMKVEKIKPDFSYFIKEDEKSEKNDCTITYDNSTIINTPGMEYLKTIEAAAKRSNFNVVFKRQMFEDANIPSGIIEVLTYNSNNELMIDRSFSIDTGVIIDRRLKLIPALYGETPYEVFPIYELKTKAPNGKGKVVDEQLLNTIFQKGIAAISKRSMYDQDTLTLNSYVDLIGLSVNGIKAEDKNAITGRIKNAIAA